VPEADDTSKRYAVIGDAKGGDWCLKVKDDKRKLGRGAECVVRPNCRLSW
jgi:hypothetical protein